MPRNKKHKNKGGQANHQFHPQHPLKSGGPLFTKKVTLSDFKELTSSVLQGNGFGRFYCEVNGVRDGDQAVLSTALPQPRIFDRYAEMFEYYQVDKMTARFIPYKWELSAAATGTNVTNARPTYSIIDPLAGTPTTPSGFMSYGNCLVTSPYKDNQRTVNYQELSLQKQQTTILRTNGSHAAREVYSNPTLIGFLGQCPNLGVNLSQQQIGCLVFTFHFTFSGQVAPGLEGRPPMPLPAQPQSTKIEEEQISSGSPDSKEIDNPPQNVENSETWTSCKANPNRIDGVPVPKEAVTARNLGTIADNTKKEIIVEGVVYSLRE